MQVLQMELPSATLMKLITAINIKKIEELTTKGLMHPAGVAAFNKRTEIKSKIYSYEKEPVKLSPEFEKKFKRNKKAWVFFQGQGAYYQKRATNWVMSAKQETTKLDGVRNKPRNT